MVCPPAQAPDEEAQDQKCPAVHWEWVEHEPQAEGEDAAPQDREQATEPRLRRQQVAQALTRRVDVQRGMTYVVDQAVERVHLVESQRRGGPGSKSTLLEAPRSMRTNTPVGTTKNGTPAAAYNPWRHRRGSG